jgi:hypothetical protein
MHDDILGESHRNGARKSCGDYYRKGEPVQKASDHQNRSPSKAAFLPHTGT